MITVLSGDGFQINVGCTNQSSRSDPVRLEYSADLGNTWHLLVAPCSTKSTGSRCADEQKDQSVYYAGESSSWRRVVIPLDDLKFCR